MRTTSFLSNVYLHYRFVQGIWRCNQKVWSTNRYLHNILSDNQFTSSVKPLWISIYIRRHSCCWWCWWTFWKLCRFILWLWYVLPIFIVLEWINSKTWYLPLYFIQAKNENNNVLKHKFEHFYKKILHVKLLTRQSFVCIFRAYITQKIKSFQQY